MHSALTLAFCAPLLLPAAQAMSAEAERPEQVQSDISTREISIQSNFTGVEIVLFGAVDFSRAPSVDEKPYDVIMTVQGPNRPIVVRKKERIAGLWMNGPSKTFPSVPGFYAVLASRPFRAIAPDETLQKLGIGFSNLDFARTPAGEPSNNRFRANLIRLQTENLLFQESDDAVKFLVSDAGLPPWAGQVRSRSALGRGPVAHGAVRRVECLAGRLGICHREGGHAGKQEFRARHLEDATNSPREASVG